MRLLLLDLDRNFVAVLTSQLARLGHFVQHHYDEGDPPDAMIVGLPAPLGFAPEKLRETPLLLLAGGSLPFGELEAWTNGRVRWALLSKPIRERALELALARIARPVATDPG